MTPPDLRVEEILEPETFASLAREWDELAEAGGSATPFSTHPWLSSWWASFPRRGRVRVLTAREADGRLAAALPLVERALPVFRLRFLRALTMMGAGISDYTEAPARPGREAAAGAAFLDHLAADPPGRWHAMLLDDFPAGAAAPDALRERAAARGLAARVAEGESTWQVPLPASHETFRGTLSSSLRKHIARTRRKVESEQGGRFLDFSRAPDLDAAMEEFFRLHQLRRASRGEAGNFADEAPRRFHREVARAFRDRGWLRLHFLEVEGRNVAAIYGFQHRGVLYYYLPGFDPEMEKLSPGSLILDRFIEAGIADGATSCDFLRGAEAYKTRWGTVERRSRNLIVSRSPARVALHGTLNRLRRRRATVAA